MHVSVNIIEQQEFEFVQSSTLAITLRGLSNFIIE